MALARIGHAEVINVLATVIDNLVEGGWVAELRPGHMDHGGIGALLSDVHLMLWKLIVTLIYWPIDGRIERACSRISSTDGRV